MYVHIIHDKASWKKKSLFALLFTYLSHDTGAYHTISKILKIVLMSSTHEINN